jgi:indolepyruvate ferredoxin oxidoreductase alpha subunit
MMGSISERINIASVVKGLGVKLVWETDPLEFKESVEILKEAMNYNGVSVVIFKSPCIALIKPEEKQIINKKCINCKKCINEIGCPAIYIDNGQVKIEQSLCYGCKLCTQICPVGAIGGVL